MIPRFELIRAATLSEAFAAYDAAGGDAAYLAGGTELLQVMKMGFMQVGTLIDLKGIPELRGIDRAADGSLRVGAATTHREVERSAIVARGVPCLATLEGRIANVRVRNVGTIGGNLAFAEPHSDPATFLIACGATIELAGPNGTRELALADFFVGPLTTAREPAEIVVAIRVPGSAAAEGRAYERIAFYERPTASVAVRLRLADGAVIEAVVAVGSVTDVPAEHPEVGAALVGAPADPDGMAAFVDRGCDALGAVDAVPDTHGSVDYKRQLLRVLLRRATRAAMSEAIARA